jgi:hypothetical protein
VPSFLGTFVLAVRLHNPVRYARCKQKVSLSQRERSMAKLLLRPKLSIDAEQVVVADSRSTFVGQTMKHKRLKTNHISLLLSTIRYKGMNMVRIPYSVKK